MDKKEKKALPPPGRSPAWEGFSVLVNPLAWKGNKEKTSESDGGENGVYSPRTLRQIVLS